MTQLSIQVTGGELVRKGLQDLSAEIPKIGKLQIYQTEQAIARRLKSYWTNNAPPQLPSYVRTGRLARGYTITAIPNGYTLSNSTPYTSYVVGNAYASGRHGCTPAQDDIHFGETSKIKKSQNYHKK